MRDHLGARRRSVTQKLSIRDGKGGRHKIYITTGVYNDGRLGEIFINTNRMGTTLNGFLDSLAMTVSIALQFGTPVEAIAKGFCGTDYPPAGTVWIQNDEEKEVPYEYPECSSMTDLLAYVLRKYTK